MMAAGMHAIIIGSSVPYSTPNNKPPIQNINPPSGRQCSRKGVPASTQQGSDSKLEIHPDQRAHYDTEGIGWLFSSKFRVDRTIVQSVRLAASYDPDV